MISYAARRRPESDRGKTYRCSERATVSLRLICARRRPLARFPLALLLAASLGSILFTTSVAPAARASRVAVPLCWQHFGCAGDSGPSALHVDLELIGGNLRRGKALANGLLDLGVGLLRMARRSGAFLYGGNRLYSRFRLS